MELAFVAYEILPLTSRNSVNFALMETVGAWSLTSAPWMTALANNEQHYAEEAKLWIYTIPSICALNIVGFVFYMLFWRPEEHLPAL